MPNPITIKINCKSMFQNGETIPLMDLIQFIHQVNQTKSIFGISWRYNQVGVCEPWFETKSPTLANKLLDKFPEAKSE